MTDANMAGDSLDGRQRLAGSTTELDMAVQAPASSNAIEIRIEDISQLFHNLDPFPFRERDLDTDAEEFIVGWARELPVDQSLRIVVHLPQEQASTPEAQDIGVAITRYFSYRAQVIALDLNELFRIGRRALAVGLTVLSLCVIANQVVAAALAPGPIGRVIEESLIIFGWVANWRPIEIFLYEWWPIVRRRNLYQRLSQARIELRPYKDDRKGSALLGTSNHLDGAAATIA
jgi:hypothetical protein